MLSSVSNEPFECVLDRKKLAVFNRVCRFNEFKIPRTIKEGFERQFQHLLNKKMKADTQAGDVLSFAEDARLNKIVYSIEQDELHRWATAVIKKRAEHDESEEKKQEEAQLNRGSMLWRVITLGYGSTGPA